MAWGDRKPEGNEKAQLPSGFLSPHAVSAGPLNITVQEDEFRGLILEAPHPSGRALPQTGQNHCAEMLAPHGAQTAPQETATVAGMFATT